MNPLAPKYKTLLDYAYHDIYERLLQKVCDASGVPVERVVSPTRKRPIAEVRMIYFKIANESHPHSIKMIGRMTNRSHSVVLSGAKVVDDVRELRQKYEDIKNQISWNKL